jgi:aminoglycoside phosphotransferase
MPPNRHDAAVEWARAVIGSPNLLAEIAWTGHAATTLRLREADADRGFLKIGGPDLAAERDRLAWLRDWVPVPDVLGFTIEPEGAWLLTEPLRGTALNRPDHKADPHRLIRLLVAALVRLHSLDPAACPFTGSGEGAVVIHGDASLPNFVYDGSELVGYLDVGNLRVGDPEVDLAAAVWSLDHNLGPGFGGEFLRAFGWPQTDEATVERLLHSPWMLE